MKTAAFTVRASPQQSARWKQAAQAEGHPSVGSWLAGAADAYLKVRAKAGLPVPLAWRLGRYVLDGREVQGKVSHPFGVFPLPGCNRQLRQLVYLPTGRVLATLRSSRNCKALASELARTWMQWDGQGGREPPGEDTGPILDRFQREDT